MYILLNKTVILDALHSSNSYVGLANNQIMDSQFTASSTYTSGALYYPPWSARLYLTAPSAMQMNHWEPSTSDSQPWIQIDLLLPYDITGIVVRGAVTTRMFVRTFTLSYLYALSLSPTTFTPVPCSYAGCAGVKVRSIIYLFNFCKPLKQFFKKLLRVIIMVRIKLRLNCRILNFFIFNLITLLFYLIIY